MNLSLPVRIVASESPDVSPRFKVYDLATGERLDFDMFHLLFDAATGETIAAIFQGGTASTHPVKQFGCRDF